MDDLITPKYRHTLWQDEVEDPFLLFDYAEVYKFSETVLVVMCFSVFGARKVRKLGAIYESQTDDPLWILHVGVDKLPELLALNKLRRRPNLEGNWLKAKEELLGHKIRPYKPHGLYR